MCEFLHFEPHDAQVEVIDALFSGIRFLAPVFGRRSGKTLLGSSFDAYGTSQKDSRGWIVAPTYEETLIVWDYLVPFMESLWGADNLKINVKRMMITTSWGASAQCKSADKPNSLAGRGLDWIHWDEPALCAKGKKIWQQMLRPALSDRKGACWFTTTPRGHNWFYDMLTTTKKGSTKVWWKQYPSHCNPHLDPPELAAMKADMDPIIYKQEILAQFVAFAGMVYELFDTEKHIISSSRVKAVTQNWERYLFVDPGLANPTAMLEVAHNSMTGEDIVVRDHQASGMLFGDVLRLANEWKPKRGWDGAVCDVAGRQRSQETNMSFVKWMKDHGDISFKHGTKSIVEGVNCVRSRLVNVDGKIRLWVSEDAKQTIASFLNYHYSENGNKELPEKDNISDHMMDGLRYGITHLHNRRRAHGRIA